MSRSTFPAQPIPVAVAPGADAPPLSPEEAAALVSRMRVEARLPRVVVVGTALGLVCGFVTMWPFVRSDEFLVDSMMSFHRARLVGWMGILAPLALVGLLLLLAFYSLRLHVQSGPSTYGAVEENLRKIRRVLAGCMAAALGAMAALIATPRDVDGLGVLALYAACCVACGVMVGDVRKGLGEFESREERQRRRVARGFAVELRGTGAAPVPAPVLPFAHTVAGAGSVDADGDVPAAAARRLPPPLPTPSQPVHPAPARPLAADLAGTGGERDLRTMLHLLAALAIGVYILRSPMIVRGIGEWPELFNARLLPSSWGLGTGPGARARPADLRLLAHVAELVLALCGVAWMAWGVTVLCFGARMRVAILVVACVTVAAVVGFIASMIGAYAPALSGFGSRGDARELIVGAANPHLPELVHAIAVLVLLTRPRVKDLFTAGSEAGEGA